MAVRWGTRPDQEIVAGTLATLPRLIHEQRLKPPATIIVGEVVRLREKLNWFERLPLFGQTDRGDARARAGGCADGAAARAGRGRD